MPTVDGIEQFGKDERKRWEIWDYFDKLKKKEPPKKAEPEILIGSNSPVCPAEAFVEQDGRTCYFYLRRFPDTREQTISSCFVCNMLDQSHVIPIAEWKKDSFWT